MRNICTINIRDKQLEVVYDKREDGLHRIFSSNERIVEYIDQHLDDAFMQAVQVEEAGGYVLNIASVEDFGYFEWSEGWSEELLKKQMKIFSPIIQKFVAAVLTNSIV